MIALKICFLLNSANLALLLSTISDNYAKMENQDKAGPRCILGLVGLVTSPFDAKYYKIEKRP